MVTPYIMVSNNSIDRYNPCLKQIAFHCSSSSSSFVFGDHHVDELCKYASKKCHQRRFLKKNGKLHNLCGFHRDKANRNQRRLEMKRKFLKQNGIKAELPEEQQQKKKRNDSNSTYEPKISTEFSTKDHISNSSNVTSSIEKDDDLIVLKDFIAEVWPVVVEQEEKEAEHSRNIYSSTINCIFNHS
jgi:hypothetical protein